MANKEHVDIVRRGADEIAKWRNENPEVVMDLKDAHLIQARLLGADLSKADLTGADLTGANLTGANLSGANLNGACLTNAYLQQANLSNVSLLGANLHNAELSETNLRDANCESDLVGARFDRCRFRNADVSSSQCCGATFQSCDIRNCSLYDVDLSGARFSPNTIVDRTVKFGPARHVSNCHIPRRLLYSLEENGELSPTQRDEIHCPNDVATLRQQFGGWTIFLHLTAASIFYLPYVWFLGSRFWMAKFDQPSNDAIALWRALGNFVHSGGASWTEWQFRLWPSLSFWIFFVANFLRIGLLIKTKTLAAEEATKGYPASFSLEASRLWYWWYRTAILFLLLGLAAFLYNVCHFLQMQIPMPTASN